MKKDEKLIENDNIDKYFYTLYMLIVTLKK